MQNIKYKILIILILLMALFLRFFYLDLTEFKHDQARDWLRAQALAQGEAFPARGPEFTFSGARVPGGLTYYLLALPALFSSHPLSGSTFVILFNLLAIFLCYCLGRDFFNEKVGLIAASLFAVSPWAIIFSRSIWNPELIPFFTILFFYCSFSWAIKKRAGYLLGILASLGCLLQLHLSCVSFILLFFLLLFLFRPPIKRGSLMGGLLIVLLLFTPYISYEITHHFENTSGILNALGSREDVSPFSMIRFISYPFYTNLSNLNFGYLLGASADSFYQTMPNPLVFSILEHLLLIGGLVLVFIKGLRNRLNPRYTILALWFLIPLIFLGVTRVFLLPHRLLLLYPLPFILVAIALERISHSKIRYLGYLVLVGIIISQITFIVGFYRFLDVNGGAAGNYGVTLKKKEEAIRYIIAEAKSSPFSVSYDFSHSSWRKLEYDYLLNYHRPSWAAGKPEKHYRIVDRFYTKIKDYSQGNLVKDLGSLLIIEERIPSHE